MISVDGEPAAVAAAERRAASAFGPVLTGLVGELATLRRPLVHDRSDAHARLRGPVARRMVEAVRPWVRDPEPAFVTPMAAVAGAVADHVLAALLGERGGACRAGLRRAAVNNGGDIALWLAPGERYRIGVCDDPRTGGRAAELTVESGDGVGGVATSGRHGRSLSLGIADAVTVLAPNAASADVAATLVANAVDLPGSACVRRVPAVELDADTDLGDRPVTIDVAPLSEAQRARALEAAVPTALRGIEGGWLLAAFLTLQGRVRTVGTRHVRPVHRQLLAARGHLPALLEPADAALPARSGATRGLGRR